MIEDLRRMGIGNDNYRNNNFFFLPSPFDFAKEQQLTRY